jgi:hypothetical protein
MRKMFFAFLLLGVSAFATNVKLYLKDGSYHIVREYKTEGDRVKYYSVERSSWEEMPVALVDLKRTESEIAGRKAALAEEAKVLSAEDKAERDLQEEVSKIPQNPGVYFYPAGPKSELKTIKTAESQVKGNKFRSILKAASPIPMVSGKATLELDKEHSLNLISDPNQEFYIQLSAAERFGIIRLTPQKGVRIVERLTIIPVSKEVVEQRDDVEILRKQMADGGLYKIWPAKPLEPGEYAVVEFSEGKLNVQVWDFAYKPAK